MPDIDRDREYEERLRASEERLRLGDTAGGVATVDTNYASGGWNWSAQAAAIFGLDKQKLDHWESAVFVDDLAKIRAAVEAAGQSRQFYVEFRVRYKDESVHWIAANGQVVAVSSQ